MTFLWLLLGMWIGSGLYYAFDFLRFTIQNKQWKRPSGRPLTPFYLVCFVVIGMIPMTVFLTAMGPITWALATYYGLSKDAS